MSLYFERGSPVSEFSASQLKEALFTAFEKVGPRKKILAIPPDFTRSHSFAGPVTKHILEYYGSKLTDILPALGTHSPMTVSQINRMFGNTPLDLFRKHDWRNDIVTLGEVPAEFVYEVSENKVNFSWPAQLNRRLTEGGHDLILSIGQVVPHEVIGMANYNKNVFVGTGGREGINKSHFLGAAYGMEKIMGRSKNPVRRVLNYASDHFAAHLPIIYILTVVGKSETGKLVVRGLYIGDDTECFEKAAGLSQKVNIKMLNESLDKVVVYLDPDEFKSTWLGNKSIYRTRMAISDGGELMVLAPGLSSFGEDPEIDRLIRKYGYRTTPEILSLVRKNEDLNRNLSAAAHLIHGSSENRFKVTYCPGGLTAGEIESVGYHYDSLDKMIKRYNPEVLSEGYNILPDGERVFYISNPALGLWVSDRRFN